jgi:hypothetical protein
MCKQKKPGNKKTAIAGGFLEFGLVSLPASLLREPTAFPPPWGWNS